MAKKNTPPSDTEQDTPIQNTPPSDTEQDGNEFAERLSHLEQVITELSLQYTELLSDLRKSGRPFKGYRRVANAKFKLEALVRATFAPTDKKESDASKAPSLFKRSVSSPTPRTIENPPAPNLFGKKGGNVELEVKNQSAPDLFKLKGAGSLPKLPAPKKEKAPAAEKGGIVLASSEDNDKD